MAAGHRLTITSIDPDPRGRALVAAIAQLGLPAPDPDEVVVADLVFVDGPLSRDDLAALARLPRRSVAAARHVDHTRRHPGVEITYLAGVTDGAAAAADARRRPARGARQGRRDRSPRRVRSSHRPGDRRRHRASRRRQPDHRALGVRVDRARPHVRWTFRRHRDRGSGARAVASRARAGRRRSGPRPRSRRAAGRAAALRRRGS